jgi:hypothetical protein
MGINHIPITCNGGLDGNFAQVKRLNITHVGLYKFCGEMIETISYWQFDPTYYWNQPQRRTIYRDIYYSYMSVSV